MGKAVERIFLPLIQLSVPDILDMNLPVEACFHNIAFVKKLVGSEPVALVTSAFHMPRTLRIAARMELNAAAFPTDWRALHNVKAVWDSWLPTADAEMNSFSALREYLALAFDRRGPNRPPAQPGSGT